MRTVLVLSLAMLLPLATPALATDPYSVPVLSSGGGAGAGWASYRFTTDGSIVAATVGATDTGSAMLAAYLYDASNALIFGFTFTLVGYPSDGEITIVDTPLLNIHTDTTAPEASGGGAGLAFTLNDPEFGGEPMVGTYKLLTFVSGHAASWDHSFRGGAGTTLDAELSGSDTFLYDGRDFTGPLHVERFSAGTGGRAQAGTDLTVPIQDRFFGVAYSTNFKIVCPAVTCVGAPSTDVLTLTRPLTTAPEACFCTLDGARAGEYAFHLTGVDASTTTGVVECTDVACAIALAYNDALIVGGADARLP